MNKAELQQFINDNISDFHSNRIRFIQGIKFSDALKRNNPYLFRTKNILTAGDFVNNIIDAYLSSQEETLFGEFLEKLAIFVCKESRGGYKSRIEGIDMEFTDSGTRYIVSIKSGPNWGNSGQIARMTENFNRAQRILRTQNKNMQIIAINGCCYGKGGIQDKGTYFKYVGQSFWSLLTGEPEFYLEIIDPLGYRAKEKNEAFQFEYIKVLNCFTKDFIIDYCQPDGAIDWEKIVKFNSGNSL